MNELNPIQAYRVGTKPDLTIVEDSNYDIGKISGDDLQRILDNGGWFEVVHTFTEMMNYIISKNYVAKATTYKEAKKNYSK